MNAIGIQQAMRTLPQLVQRTITDAEETVIVAENGAVVLIDQREWEQAMETLRLFQDKTSLRALLDGHKARDAGRIPAGVTFEEAFHDLQDSYSEKRP